MTTDALAPQLISVFPVTCILRLLLASGCVVNCEDKTISYKKNEKKPESRKVRHHQLSTSGSRETRKQQQNLQNLTETGTPSMERCRPSGTLCKLNHTRVCAADSLVHVTQPDLANNPRSSHSWISKPQCLRDPVSAIYRDNRT